MPHVDSELEIEGNGRAERDRQATPDARTGISTGGEGTESNRTIQVLEFDLGEETYCVDISYVAEIVDMDEFTAIPNSPRHIEGVMDLRGKTTSIIDPKILYSITEEGERKRIVVFDPAELGGGATGWVVDEVDQVIRISEADVDESPVVDDDSIRGIVKRDGGFVLWVDPEAVNT